ncbi:uncharacterized protein ASCRUDRAFT_82708 [Ascoidea rubescens DSM 1968]|uniref:Uncharacterized protein n=1 Tax=Ascoidea rubescens DSM 1968 TaxID=1344418 RepID=A0A1D2VAB2_9ASCO|nr:hypothetical protein ASCRUDRAFT_82708 [Ascoidea rubescens DSM 1968]ODV58551.1 hypothetical protein ASCRUDRAFT_82708 [Ascoidea rubescens DSM 1968]
MPLMTFKHNELRESEDRFKPKYLQNEKIIHYHLQQKHKRHFKNGSNQYNIKESVVTEDTKKDDKYNKRVKEVKKMRELKELKELESYKERLNLLENQLLFEQGANIKLNAAINHLLEKGGKASKSVTNLSYAASEISTLNSKESKLSKSKIGQRSMYQINDPSSNLVQSSLKIKTSSSVNSIMNSSMDSSIEATDSNSSNLNSNLNLNLNLDWNFDDGELIELYKNLNRDYQIKDEEKIEENNSLKIANEDLIQENMKLQSEVNCIKMNFHKMNTGWTLQKSNNDNDNDNNSNDGIKKANSAKANTIEGIEKIEFSDELLDEIRKKYIEIYNDPTRIMMKIDRIPNDILSSRLKLLDCVGGIEMHTRFSQKNRRINELIISSFYEKHQQEVLLLTGERNTNTKPDIITKTANFEKREGTDRSQGSHGGDNKSIDQKVMAKEIRLLDIFNYI